MKASIQGPEDITEKMSHKLQCKDKEMKNEKEKIKTLED